jgi:hypothetical protein
MEERAAFPSNREDSNADQPEMRLTRHRIGNGTPKPLLKAPNAATSSRISDDKSVF